MALGIQVLQLMISNRLWAGVVARVSGTRIGWLEGFAHMAMVNLGRYLPGKLWGAAARLAVLARRGLDARVAVAATAVEQLALAHGNIVLGLLLLPFVLPVPGGLALLAWAAAGVSVLAAPRFLSGGQSLLRRWPRVEKMLPADGAAVARAYRPAALAYMAAWACNGVVLYMLFLALFGAHAQPSDLLRTLFANACGAFAGALAVFAPAGVGVREGAAAGMLTAILPLQDALFLLVVLRVWMVIVDALLGVALMLFAMRR